MRDCSVRLQAKGIGISMSIRGVRQCVADPQAHGGDKEERRGEMRRDRDSKYHLATMTRHTPTMAKDP